MIEQTIFPRVNTHIAAISKSYRFNGGTAAVQVDSLGNYEVMVNGFSKLSMRTVNPMLNYYDWPRVDALRMVRRASQFDPFDAVSFKNAITQVMADNGILDETSKEI